MDPDSTEGRAAQTLNEGGRGKQCRPRAWLSGGGSSPPSRRCRFFQPARLIYGRMASEARVGHRPGTERNRLTIAGTDEIPTRS
jgi:hypothetical protein